MKNCLFCQKELTHFEGRKQKSFCNVNCRNKYFYKKRSDLIKQAINGNGKHEEKEEEKEVVTETITIPDNEIIQKQIQSIRNEKIPDYRNTPIGKKVWESDQKKKISELQKQLNPPI